MTRFVSAKGVWVTRVTPPWRLSCKDKLFKAATIENACTLRQPPLADSSESTNFKHIYYCSITYKPVLMVTNRMPSGPQCITYPALSLMARVGRHSQNANKNCYPALQRNLFFFRFLLLFLGTPCFPFSPLAFFNIYYCERVELGSSSIY